jgi:broad specificity phosphatase PhoE
MKSPPRKKLYLVRHGESVGNVGKYQQGPTTPLSDIGHLQAKLIAKRFKTIHLDVILTSPYRRAHQTAEAIAQIVDLTPEKVDLLHEYKRPSELEGQSYQSSQTNKIRQIIEVHKNKPDWHYADEENLFDLIKRGSKCIDMMTNRREKNIVAVTHGTFMRTILAVMMMGEAIKIKELETFFQFTRLDNTGLTLCELTDDGWHLRTLNDHAHLG